MAARLVELINQQRIESAISKHIPDKSGEFLDSLSWLLMSFVFPFLKMFKLIPVTMPDQSPQLRAFTIKEVFQTKNFLIVCTEDEITLFVEREELKEHLYAGQEIRVQGIESADWLFCEKIETWFVSDALKVVRMSSDWSEFIAKRETGGVLISDYSNDQIDEYDTE